MIQVAKGVHLYTGHGLHPFREGDAASVPTEHADDLVAAKLVVRPGAKPATPAPAGQEAAKTAT